MTKYKYVAVNLQKEQFKGVFVAENEKDLAVQLAKQNLYLISASVYSDKTPSAFFSLGTGKITIAELNTFCRQFAIMINAGISIVGCLEILKSQSYTAFFKGILEMAYDDVKSGVMLSASFDKHKKVFPNFFRSMIYVGEASGKLDVVLTSLADYYETDAKIKKKTKSALSYPLMLAGMLVGIVAAMMLFIVPTFRESLSSLDVQPEGITKIVYDLSDYMLENGLYILAGIVALGLILFIIGRTEKGKYFYDCLILKIPLVNTVSIDLITARFARGFGLLLSSGMDIIDAMEVIVIVMGNRSVEERFRKAMEDVRHGMSLTMALDSYKLFPQMMIQMISVGERTAALPEVLGRSCSFFDEQVESSLTSLTSKIQPAMLIIMGGVVGILFVAIYSPMLSIMTTIV